MDIEMFECKKNGHRQVLFAYTEAEARKRYTEIFGSLPETVEMYDLAERLGAV